MKELRTRYQKHFLLAQCVCFVVFTSVLSVYITLSTRPTPSPSPIVYTPHLLTTILYICEKTASQSHLHAHAKNKRVSGVQAGSQLPRSFQLLCYPGLPFDDLLNSANGLTTLPEHPSQTPTEPSTTALPPILTTSPSPLFSPLTVVEPSSLPSPPLPPQHHNTAPP